MDKAYNPQEHEDQQYAAWEKSGFFNPDNLPARHTEPYAIMMPPPNVTGVLHLGHALENTIMDIQVRYQRMQGKRALIVPGTDHAAIATQARVESNLHKEGIADPRAEFGRDGLLEKIRVYAEQSKATILGQIKKMGTSADWSRLAYTFDEDRSRVVNTVFKQMFDDGLIYRGSRLINWSTGAQSVLSDDELEYEDRSEPFYYIRAGEFVIGTVRPETKCADSPLVVHPTAEYARVKFTPREGAAQYFIVIKSLLDNEARRSVVFNQLDPEGTFEVDKVMTGKEMEGQTFEYNTYAGKRTFTVLADEVIDPEKGAGSMTISAAHSADDYALAQNRGLKNMFIEKIDKQGRMTSVTGPVAGMTILEARKEAARFMQEQGLLTGVDAAYSHRVPLCYRSGCVVEPMISPQWFVDVNKEVPGRGKSLKVLMHEAVTTGLDGDSKKLVTIQPDNFRKIYMHWIENLHDWCISRQIWWGHRIPIWTRGEGDAQETYCGDTAPAGEGWEQDPDTLDTWFSSGMWPFATLGWPEGKDFAEFFPTAWIQMGHEILQLWMARMILFSAYTTQNTPFRSVYIHGMLRDKNGDKFSKSKGNGIDPLDVIKQYGTDALRLSLIKGIAPGADSRFYEDKVADARNFVNKLWNVSRFVTMQKSSTGVDVPLTTADQLIMPRVARLITEVTQDLDNCNFSQASEKLYTFIWHEYADWYLEMTKNHEPGSCRQLEILKVLLRLCHPFMPFITEVLAKEVNVVNEGEFLMVQSWPSTSELLNSDTPMGGVFDQLQDVVTQVRRLRKDKGIEAGKKIPAKITITVESIFADVPGPLLGAIQSDLKKYIHHFCRTEEAQGDFKSGVTVSSLLVTVDLDLAGVQDVAQEKARITKQIAEIQKHLKSIEAKLQNEKFMSSARPDIVEQTKALHAERSAEIAQLQKSLEALR